MKPFCNLILVLLIVFLMPVVHQLNARRPASAPASDSLSITDMQYLRSMSSMLKDMEDSLGINEQNMVKKIRLTKPALVPVFDTAIEPLRLPYNDDLTTMLFLYAHGLYRAIQLPLYKKYCREATARTLSRGAFADSLNGLESKAIVNTIMVGLESGSSHQLPYPTRLINAVIDKVKRKINTATLLYLAFDYTKKAAKDEDGVLLYIGFLKYYDRLIAAR
ncbi:MAG: hypothetical protein ABIX01_19895 [Chitinophagaceae bacterium]